MKDYKTILEGVVNIINTTEKSDIGFANICTYIGENCPELKESEDERIRKDIINYLALYKDAIGEEYESWIAWLEKQGKTSPILSNSSNIGKVEQKPTENKGMNLKEEEMTPFQKAVFYIIDTNIEAEVGLKQECDELLRLAHDEIMQDTAWSEEDDVIAHDIDYALRSQITYPISRLQSMSTWILNLKDRVQPQPKQGWSEEDDKHLERILKELKNQWQRPYNRPYLDEIVSDYYWLKFLKYRYTWRPSDEQINALKFVMEDIEKDSLIYPVLNSVLEDLKKYKKRLD